MTATKNTCNLFASMHMLLIGFQTIQMKS